MKDFIAVCAVVILLLSFPVQYALNIRNHYEMSLVQKHVNNAKELSRLQGCFTDAIVEELKTNIESDTAIEKDEIEVVSETMNTQQRRGMLIHYSVSVPIHKLIALEYLWGISAEDNTAKYTIDNYAVSEWVDR